MTSKSVPNKEVVAVHVQLVLYSSKVHSLQSYKLNANHLKHKQCFSQYEIEGGIFWTSFF